MNLTASEAVIKRRYNVSIEAEEEAEIGEEPLEALRQKQEAGSKDTEDLMNLYAPNARTMKFVHLDTNGSLENTQNELKANFLPRVIIVNHEKRLGIDTTCSNLAVKYQMIYISAYQLIRQHIQGNTPWGIKLNACRRMKPINLTSQVRDEFNEAEYSPAHYDFRLVVELIKDTIKKVQTS